MIKPYYEDEAVVIYHGDCRDILPQLPKVDLVLTDPDYNQPSIRYETQINKMPDEEYRHFCQEWFTLALWNSPNMLFTPGLQHIWNYPPAKWIIAWHKSSSPCKSPIGGFNVWEPILVYGNPVCRFGHDYLNYQPLNFIQEEWATEHPCPKNPELWSMLIEKATKPDQVILDPFLGSGTTVFCAKKLGRKAIGIEIEERYCEIAANRCRQMVMPL